MEPMVCAKKTPLPSGASMEYATYTSSPTVATAGGGRLQPFELMSVESTESGGAQVFPESVDELTSRFALLSFRGSHHTANARVAPIAAAIELAQRTRGWPASLAEPAT